MATKAHAFIVHPAKGGLNTHVSPTLLQPDELQRAINIEYYNPGRKQKRLGTRLQGVLSGGPEIQALADYWAFTTTPPDHQFLAATSAGVYIDDDCDGTWVQAAPSVGWGAAGTTADIVMAGGYAVFFNGRGDQKPLKYDGTTVSQLSACTPNTMAGVYHLRRLWAFTPNSSRLYFSAASDVTDWDGEDANSLLFDEEDGDRIVGVSKPFRGGLYVFKGPNIGSIHAVTGRTIRQFARDRLAHTAPCVSHKSIVTTTNDIYWLSSYGVHSLNATQKYGNTEEAYVSAPIKNLWDDFQTNQLTRAVAFYHPTRSIIGWFVPDSGHTTNGTGLIYNYALGIWSIWIHWFHVASAMVAKDPSVGLLTDRPRLYYGGYSGSVYAADQTQLTDSESLAYTAYVKFAAVSRFSPEMTELHEKSFQAITTFFTPNATGSHVQLNVSVDGRGQTFTVGLTSASAPVFGSSSSAIFGSMTFGGVTGGISTFEVPFAERGRVIELEYVQAGANQDLNILGYAIRAVPAEMHALEAS